MQVVTTEGEKVEIVEREIKDGSRPFESVVLTAEDGRTFRPLGGGQVEEISVMPAGEADLADVVADEELVNETERLTAADVDAQRVSGDREPDDVSGLVSESSPVEADAEASSDSGVEEAPEA